MDLKDLGQTLLGDTALGMVEGFFNQFFGKRAADYQYQLSEQAAEKAYERQLNFWAKQNAYNDPSNVKHRLMQAGINPASMSAQSAVPAGQLSNAPQANPDGYTAPNVQINSFVDTLKTLAESNFIDEETKLKAQELLNQQIQEGINKALRARGWSEARLSELDRRAKWKAFYGEDSEVPNNPYWEDDSNLPIIDRRNPFYQSTRNEQAEAEGRELLNSIQGFEVLKQSQIQELFWDYGIDYNNLPADVQTQVGLCMVALRVINDVIAEADYYGEDDSKYQAEKFALENKLNSIIKEFHVQSKQERNVKGMPSVNQLMASTYSKIAASDFAHRVTTSARDDIHKWYTSVLDYFGISH